jgi:DNA invertase Pin-like site-specific DNA recombinase
LLKERQREGIALAKKRGAYRGRKRILSPEQVTYLKTRIAVGEKKAKVVRDMGISRETLYQYLRQRQEAPEPDGVMRCGAHGGASSGT